MASTNKDKLKELLGKIAISTNTITVEEDINHYTVLELLNALRSNVKEIDKIVRELDEATDQETILKLMKRLNGVVNIEEYADKVTKGDWTPAIQQAINDGVKTLVFDSGKGYLVKSAGTDEYGRNYAINLNNIENLTIEGYNGTTIYTDYSQDSLPNVFRFENCNHIRIRGIIVEGINTRTIDQPSTPLYSGAAFYFRRCKDIIVEDCKTHNVTYHTIAFNTENIIVDKAFNYHDYFNQPFQASTVPYAFVQFHSSYGYELLNSVHYGGCRDGDVGVFGGGGLNARIENNRLLAYGYNDSTKHTYNISQGICNDQGCNNCLIRGNFLYGYYMGIDMKADVRNTICENNILEHCKISIADRRGESQTVYQTQFNVIRGNKIIFGDNFEDNGYLHNGMYHLVGINCENRQGCWIENNELTYDFSNLNIQKPILGIYASQEDINHDYLYPSIIKGNNVVFTVGNIGTVRHAPGGSTLIHLRNIRCVNILHNSLKGSYTMNYFGIKLQGTISDITVKDNLFWTGNIPKIYTEQDTTVTNWEYDIDHLNKKCYTGKIESYGSGDEYQRFITDKMTVSTNGTAICRINGTPGTIGLITIKGCANWGGLRYINATYSLSFSNGGLAFKLVDGVANGFEVHETGNDGTGTNICIKTDVDVPGLSFDITLHATQYQMYIKSVN